MRDKERKEVEILLKNLESQLEKDIQAARMGSAPVELDQQSVGRVSRIDAIQQQQMQLSSLQRMEQRLAMVRFALTRLPSEGFGLCTRCEEPISFDRLRARPESPFCLVCASSQDS